MNEIIQLTGKEKLKWVPQKFQDEFIQELMNRYYEYAKTDLVGIHTLVSEMSYEIVQIASYYETNGKDVNFFFPLIDDEEDSGQMITDIVEEYYQDVYMDIYSVMESNYLTSSCGGIDDYLDRTDLIHFSTEVW